jgi:pimeloyl-ACP methyl ester carboxylesterase
MIGTGPPGTGSAGTGPPGTGSGGTGPPGTGSGGTGSGGSGRTGPVASFLAASRSLLQVIGRHGRYWEMMAGIRAPVLLIGGEADRLVPATSMRQAAARNPHWESVILTGVGHTPQLKAPDPVIGTIRDWLDRHFTPNAGEAG